jgi:hypothetical protein
MLRLEALTACRAGARRCPARRRARSRSGQAPHRHHSDRSVGCYDYTTVDSIFEVVIPGNDKRVLAGLEGNPETVGRSAG